MVRRCKSTREIRTPLDLARALLRYSRMADPVCAYERVHAEWHPDVACILEKVLWTEVKIAHRTVAEVAAELHGLNRKAEAQAKAVKALMAAKKLPLEDAVSRVVARGGKQQRPARG